MTFKPYVTMLLVCRKTLPKKKIQVKVGSGGVAAALDDGYSWRKYGNKNILGSKHSRSSANQPLLFTLKAQILRFIASHVAIHTLPLQKLLQV